MIGGVATSAILDLLLYPVSYVLWRSRRLLGPAREALVVPRRDGCKGAEIYLRITRCLVAPSNSPLTAEGRGRKAKRAEMDSARR